MKNNNSLEEQILAAAEELFIQKGFTETSTTDIAKKVGCNQALVHYYFRTKDNLFEQIFLQKVEFALSCVDSYHFNGNFKELITTMITNYFQFLSNNRQLPFFVLNELVINEKRREFIRKHIFNNPHRQKIYYALDQIVQNEVQCGHIRPIETLDLLLNIVALTISTFILLPIYADWLQKDESAQTAFIEHRKNIVINLILTDLSV